MPDFKQKQILVIDDDPMTRLLVRKMLEGSGYLVAEAPTADEGIATALEVIPHVILCDIRMPGKSGIEFLASVKNIRELKGIPVIMVSAVQDQNTVFEATAYGAVDYVHKPVETRVLIQKLNRLFQNSEFFKKVFDSNNQPTLTVRISGVITGCTNGGFVFESNVRMAENAVVTIKSQLLDEVGADKAMQKRTERLARLSENGLFANDILFVGVSKEMLQLLRSKVKGW